MRWLLVVFLTAAAAYGGWRGRDIWSGWGIWAFPLLPALWAMLLVARQRGAPTTLRVAAPLIAALGIGGLALAIAWSVAEATVRWSADPLVRAVAAAGVVLAGLALTALGYRKRSEPAGEVNTEGEAGQASK